MVVNAHLTQLIKIFKTNKTKLQQVAACDQFLMLLCNIARRKTIFSSPAIGCTYSLCIWAVGKIHFTYCSTYIMFQSKAYKNLHVKISQAFLELIIAQRKKKIKKKGIIVRWKYFEGRFCYVKDDSLT